MIAAIWWRVSTRGQLELSPETQIKESRALLESQGYTVPDKYVIGADWHSLDTLQCPQMQTLLGWVSHAEIQAIGMINSDRLSGEMAQKLAIMDMTEKKGVKLISVENPIESGPDGQLLETVRTYGKYLQVIRAQEGAKKGLRDRVEERGLPANMAAPYGYRFIDSVNDRGKKAARLVPNDCWHIAQDIWRMALSGSTMRGIVTALYERGVTSPRGCEAWRPKAIFRILHNPAYAGRYAASRFTYQKYGRDHQRNGQNNYSQTLAKPKPIEEWIFLDDVEVEQPLVSWGDFLAMQERLTLNQTMSKRNAKRVYLLRGMIHCDVHNRSYRGKCQTRPSGNSVNLLYCCPVANAKEMPLVKCPKPSMSGPAIEAEIWGKATDLLTSPDTIIGGLERQQKMQVESEEVIRAALSSIVQRQTKMENQEMELVTLRLRGDFGDEIYQRQLALLKAERSWCQDEGERLERQLESMQQRALDVEKVRAMCSQFSSRLDNATEEDRRFILESLGTKVTVSEDGRIRLTFSLPDFSHYVSSSRVSDQGTSATSS